MEYCDNEIIQLQNLKNIQQTLYVINQSTQKGWFFKGNDYGLYLNKHKDFSKVFQIFILRYF